MDFRLDDDSSMLRDGLTRFLQAHAPPPTRRATEPLGDAAGRWSALADAGWFEAFEPDAGWFVRGLVLAEAFGGTLLPEPVAATAGFLLPLLDGLGGAAAREVADRVRRGATAVAVPTDVLGADGHPVGPWRWSAPAATVTPGQVPAGHLGRVSGTLSHVALPPAATVACLPALGPDGGVWVLQIPLDREGVTLQAQDTVQPGRQVGHLVLDGVVLAAADVVTDGVADHRDEVVAACAAHGRFLDGQALGGAQAVLDRSIDHARGREQFGVPIGSFQAVKHLLAEAAVRLEAARSLAYLAAWEADTAGPRAAAPNLAASRLRTAAAFRQVAETGIQVRGATGFTWEDGAHLWLRAAMFDASIGTDRRGIEASFAEVIGSSVG